MFPGHFIRYLVPITLFTLAALPSLGQAGGKKYAFIVGINFYDRLPKLQFAVNDATELASTLRRAGYQVTLLTDQAAPELRPTKANIEKQFQQVMAGFQKGDLVVIALAGHGLIFAEDPDAYFCPSDAQPLRTQTGSLVSLNKIYQLLRQSAEGARVLLVDACRPGLDLKLQASGLNADSAPPSPRGVAALFSCSAGQTALESPQFRHGVFFYHILEGLAGKARNSAAEVTYHRLAEYVMRQVPRTVKKLVNPEAAQEPNQNSNLRGIPVLVTRLDSGTSSTTAQPQKLTIDLGNNIPLELVFIPAGEFVMGSPKDEAGRGDDENHHAVTLTQAFWMGQYEVTQEQYQQIMGKNPSWFSPRGEARERVAGLDTRRFPVDWVTWHEAMEFCARVTHLPNLKRAGLVCSLPTEAQWEYACRAGGRGYTVFHFGDSLHSGQANFDGRSPYGATAKGIYLGRTRAADFGAGNDFGLSDMHGNVWEWCADWYDESYYRNAPRTDPAGPAAGKYRVVRGGSWAQFGRACRSAWRNGMDPTARYTSGGFRVVVRRAP